MAVPFCTLHFQKQTFKVVCVEHVLLHWLSCTYKVFRAWRSSVHRRISDPKLCTDKQKQLYGAHLHLFLSFTWATVSLRPLTSQLCWPYPPPNTLLINPSLCSIIDPPTPTTPKAPRFCQSFPRLPVCLLRPCNNSSFPAKLVKG